MLQVDWLQANQVAGQGDRLWVKALFGSAGIVVFPKNLFRFGRISWADCALQGALWSSGGVTRGNCRVRRRYVLQGGPIGC